MQPLDAAVNDEEVLRRERQSSEGNYPRIEERSDCWISVQAEKRIFTRGNERKGAGRKGFVGY